MTFPIDKHIAAVLNSLAHECFMASSKKGFHEDHEVAQAILKRDEEGLEYPDRTLEEWLESTAFQAEIARMHSELSEALESVRKPKPDDHLPHFDNVVVELADCIIRILDTCGKRGLPIGEAVIEKIQYNTSRPHKHRKNS